MSPPSTSSFNRVIRSCTTILTDIYNDVNAVDPTIQDAKNNFISLQQTLNAKFDEIKQRLDPYYTLGVLPEGLTDEALETGLASVEKLHMKIFSALQLHVANLSQPTSTTPTTSTSTSNTAMVSLPKFDIKKFSGRFQDWPNFYARFESLVHTHKSLSASQKFQYLISLLEQQPLQIIEHLSISDSNYSVALEHLKERYYNPRRLIVYHCEQLLKLPVFDSKSAASMRTFLDQYNINFNSLQTIPDIDVLESIFTTFILSKLDLNTKTRFESHAQQISFPKLAELIEFLKLQVVQKENTALVKEDFDSSRKKAPIRKLPVLYTSPASKCPLCDSSDHRLFSCKGFIAKSPHDRFNFIRQNKLCTNCLGNHNMSKCGSKHVCHSCAKRHHSLLHFNEKSNSVSTNHLSTDTSANHVSVNCVTDTSIHSSPISPPPGVSASMLQSSAHSIISSPAILMATCLVRLQTSPSNYIVARAVLDTASHASFITERCAQLLKVARGRTPITISGIGQTVATSSGTCQLSLTTIPGDIVSQTQAFIIMPKISTNTPVVKISPQVCEAVQAFQLADPTFAVPAPVDVLLSADIAVAAIQGVPKSLGPSMPYIVPTVFGHVLMGEAPPEVLSCHLSCINPLLPYPVDPLLKTSLHRDFHMIEPSVSSLITSDHGDLLNSLQRFWEVEEPPPYKPELSEDEKWCEQLYSSTTTRNSQGRYSVRLPFKPNTSELGDSYSSAVKRLYSLERKFKSDPKFQSHYIEFMRDYQAQGHMIPVPPNINPVYFIPHHGIFKSHGDTSKIRVVFDASCKTSSGMSLNDILCSGPKLQTLITDVLTLFRIPQYVFICDCSQMFRQIQVHESDQPFQCILWREAPHLPVKPYFLTTVTYGLASSPYLAIRTLLQLAQDEGHNYPLAATVLRQSAFVDDILGSGNTLSSALHLRNEVIALLAKGGFVLKKWSSNHPDLIQDIPPDCRQLSSDTPIALLGLRWDPSSDKFFFNFFSNIKIPDVGTPVTKRAILSQIASLYDPCGWVSPVVIKAKCFLQELWRLPLEWDTPLPDDLAERWYSFLHALPSIASLPIPRPFVTGVTSYQLHGFCDASKSAYGAVLYLRTIESNPKVTLVSSKTRVTPVKSPTLPRLELLDAHLLAKLLHHYLSLLGEQVQIVSVYLWCDSTIVLQWLRIPPIKLKTFVADRVCQILEWTQPDMWHHVSSGDNPADVASRGIAPNQLAAHSLWWVGPPWLQQTEAAWPQSCLPSNPETTLEINSAVSKSILISSAVKSPDVDLFPSLSTWSRIIRVVSKILWWRDSVLNHNPTLDLLSLYDRAFHCICRHIQLSSFSHIFKALEKNEALARPLQRLTPFVDNTGLIRIAGRVPSSDPTTQPILLPKQRRLVHLLIDDYHVRFAHAGPAFIQAELTHKVWILSARQTIRSRVFSCIRCYRARPKTTAPFMSNLPLARVMPSPVFYHTGMDFAGPFQTKLHHLRKAPIIKTYLCIFICFSSKAVHLELAQDLSVPAFLDALHCFVSRRSAPAHLYSDNGTNFVGTAAKLNKEWQQLLSKSSDSVLHYSAYNGIKFQFSPPAAPHFGGLWERAVRSAKSHITRVVGLHTLTVPQLRSLFIRVEAILNSRPLTTVSSDPKDLEVLTPSHFLVGRPMVAPPPSNVKENTDLVTKFNLIQTLTQHFWQRWRAEYLPNLQPRTKWLAHSTNLQVGDMVIMEEPNSPPLAWPLGRILEVYPSPDKVVRKAKVHTTHGDYTRPVVRLYRLPSQNL